MSTQFQINVPSALSKEEAVEILEEAGIETGEDNPRADMLNVLCDDPAEAVKLLRDGEAPAPADSGDDENSDGDDENSDGDDENSDGDDDEENNEGAADDDSGADDDDSNSGDNDSEESN